MAKKGVKYLAFVSALFLSANFMSCTSVNPVIKHKIGKKISYDIKTKNKYAILALGSSSKTYLTDVFLDKKAFHVYDGLKEMGFSDENIIFLVGPFSRKITDERMDLPLTDDMLKLAGSTLAKKISKDDLLFFCYVGHGDGDKNLDEYVLGGTRGYFISRKVLNEEINKLDFKYSILIFDSCYSGNFAEKLGKKNKIAVSTVAKGKLGAIYSGFTNHLMDGLNGEEEADKDNDGKVSLEEAVYYAAKKDPWSKKRDGLINDVLQEPQIYYGFIDPSEVFLKEKKK